MESFIAVDFV